MKRPILLSTLLLLPLLAWAGCGESDPDPGTILDRALTRENLAGFGNGPEGPAGGTVTVQALGYEDRVLEETRVRASPAVMSEIRGALGADSGLRAMVENLEYEGNEGEDGIEVHRISGELDPDGLANALEQAGGVEELAGFGPAGATADAEGSLAEASFSLEAGGADGVIKSLDLILAIDDPGNALPPTRVRFTLKPDPSSESAGPSTTP